MGFADILRLYGVRIRPVITDPGRGFIIVTSTSKSTTGDATREITPKFASMEFVSNNF